MKIKKIDQQIHYDGSQLRSLYAYLEHGVLGDSIIAFQGSCDVAFEHMIDGEDLLAQAKIQGKDMMHFIVEVFEQNLNFAVCLQRLLATIVADTVRDLAGTALLVREGDDLYWETRKFSISIATQSPVSFLIHFAVNVTNESTPVLTCALNNWDIDADEFVNLVLKRFQTEFLTLKEATQKVRWAH